MSKSKKEPTKAIGYCRVAATKQVRGYSNLDFQRRQIEEIANRLNLKIVEYFAQVGHEPVTFPYDTLGKALKYCKANPDLKYLVIAKPDRLTRSLEEYLFWKISFKRAGVSIVSSSEPDSPMSDFVENLHMMMGQLEHERRSEMVKRAIQRKKAQEA